MQAQAADVDAVDGDAPLARIVRAAEQAECRGLARAGGTDERDRAAGAHAERKVLERRMRCVVAERHVFERDLAADGRQVGRARLFVQRRRRVEHGEEIAEGVRLEKQARDEAGELLEPADEHHRETDETDETDDRADRDLALEVERRAEHEDRMSMIISNASFQLMRNASGTITTIDSMVARCSRKKPSQSPNRLPLPLCMMRRRRPV
jgi:hypothetical protein